MRTTIDAAGRLVVPRRLRDQLGFGPGQQLELSAVDGRLEIELPPTDMRLEERDGDLVAVVDTAMPTLTAEQVRESLEGIRR